MYNYKLNSLNHYITCNFEKLGALMFLSNCYLLFDVESSICFLAELTILSLREDIVLWFNLSFRLIEESSLIFLLRVNLWTPSELLYLFGFMCNELLIRLSNPLITIESDLRLMFPADNSSSRDVNLDYSPVSFLRYESKVSSVGFCKILFDEELL